MTFLAEMPDWLFNAASAILGIVGTLCVVVIRNRRVLLTYHFTHEPIGISGSDSIHGEVKVTIGNQPAQKLYMSNVWLINRGWQDVEDLEVRVCCGQDMRLVSEFVRIEGEPIILKYTEEHRGEWDCFWQAFESRKRAETSGNQAEVQRLDQVIEPMYRNLSTSRCYAVPVFSRGQTIRFTHMTEVAHGAKPGISLFCQKAGVRIQYKAPYQPIGEMWGVPVDQAGIAGLGIAVLGWLVVISTVPSLWLAALICLVVGACCSFPGAGVVKVSKWIRARLMG